MNVSWFGRFAEVARRGQTRAPSMLVLALALAAIAALSACGGESGDDEPEATTPAGETAAPDAATPTAGATLAEITSLCDLVTPEDVEEVVGESVTGSNEFKDVSCGYSVGDGGLNIERGSQQDFEVGIFQTGELGEPVSGIGDQAAWFGDVAGGSNTLAVGKGDFYFQLRMNLADLDSAAQLEAAKSLAAKAVERLP